MQSPKRSEFPEPFNERRLSACASQSLKGMAQPKIPATLPVQAPATPPTETGVPAREPDVLEARRITDSSKEIEAGQKFDEDKKAEPDHGEGNNVSFRENIAAAASSMTAQAASVAFALRKGMRELAARLSISGPALLAQEEPEEQRPSQSIETKSRISGSLRERVMTRRLSSVRKGEAKKEAADDARVCHYVLETSVT